MITVTALTSCVCVATLTLGIVILVKLVKSRTSHNNVSEDLFLADHTTVENTSDQLLPSELRWQNRERNPYHNNTAGWRALGWNAYRSVYLHTFGSQVGRLEEYDDWLVELRRIQNSGEGVLNSSSSKQQYVWYFTLQFLETHQQDGILSFEDWQNTTK